MPFVLSWDRLGRRTFILGCSGPRSEGVESSLVAIEVLAGVQVRR